MKNSKLYKYILISVLISIFFLLSNCENVVGLGEAINLKGPELTITSPLPEGDHTEVQVPTVFEIKGLSKSATGTTRMEINMTRYGWDPVDETNKIFELGREWRYIKGSGWEWKENSDSPWTRYTVESYTSEFVNTENVDLPLWVTSGDTVTWSIPITLYGYPKGDFFFTIRAWDTAGNSGEKSMQKPKIYHDNEGPELTITNFTFGTLYRDIDPPEGDNSFDNFIYDPINKWNETLSDINKWVSRNLEFGWEIDKEIIGNYALTIEITNQYNLNAGTGKKLYYSYVWDGAALPKNGIFTNGNAPAGYIKVGNSIPVNDIVPRDNETGLPTGEILDPNEYHLMQIVVRLSDGNGIMDSNPAKGWFPYRPAADKPYSHITFGYKHDPAKITPPTAPDSDYILRNRATNAVSIFDNNGVKSISWELYALNETGLEPISGSASGSGTHIFTDERTQETWNFESSFDPGRYKLDITATDKDGIIGDTYISYFSIESASTPQLKNRQLIEPVSTVPLLGDSNGNFLIKGIAQIYDSDTPNYNSVTGTGNAVGVNRVTIVWIKPGNNFINDILLYQDRNYSNWDNAKNIIGTYSQDSSGNRIWEVPSTSIVFDPSSDGNAKPGENATEGVEEYSFEKQLNLFNDLDIKPGFNTTGDQTFLIRVLSEQQGRAKSSVARHDQGGDTDPPLIKIEEIIVTEWNEATSSYETPKVYERKGQNFDMISTGIDTNDKIRLVGTWTDNSLETWTALSPEQLKPYFTNFNVSWVGENETLPLVFDYSVVKDGNTNKGEWSTNEYTFTKRNEAPIVTLTSEIMDHNGILGRDQITVIIKTDTPTLTRITSDTRDGEYGENKDTYPLDEYPGVQNYIDIFLEFSEQVKLFDNTGLPPYFPSDPEDLPYLVLNNNGGRAFYFTGNGEYRLGFRYFINGAADGNTMPSGSSSVSHNGYGGSSSNGRLNVTDIHWTNAYPETSLVSIDGEAAVLIPPAVFQSNSDFSLARSKNIVIDKDNPILSTLNPAPFVTTASSDKPHGVDSYIYITVNFDETITVNVTNSANFYLNLTGGLTGQRAVFDNVSGANSVTFLYVVEQGHNTNAGDNLRIVSIESSGAVIRDIAENIYVNTAITNSNLNRNLIIDTTGPQSPTVSGLVPNTTYYGNETFNITGLESDKVSVEYCLNYNISNPSAAVWVSVPNTYTIQGSVANGYSINGIPIELNGTYNIAARQYDNATTPNLSAVPAAANILSSVTVDRGAFLTRLGSSTPDGIYGINSDIEIDLVFRKPVHLTSHTFDVNGNLTSSSNATLTMRNLSAGTAQASLVKRSSDFRTYTFRFTVAQGQLTDRLDVAADGLNLGNLQFYDAASGGTLINPWINIADIKEDASGFRLPKNIEILTGNPAPINNTFATTNNTSAGIRYYQINSSNTDDGYYLDIQFNRDIYRGDTSDQLVVTQIQSGYRVPTILTEAEWMNIFVGRSFGSINASQWRRAGDYLYQKGSNGADLSVTTNENSTLKPITEVKYILRYDFDTRDNVTGTTNITFPPTTPAGSDTFTINYNTVKDNIRASEAVTFGAKDSEVEIVNINLNNEQRPRILRIKLTSSKTLHVRGASYEWSLPAGFVKDFLENANNTINTVGSNNLTRGGIEVPVIRINKGKIETITGSGNDRQAQQPVTSEFRIDCRTPASTLQYRTRQTTDNVARLIMRSTTNITSNWNDVAAASIPYNRLPNLGNQKNNDTSGKDTFAQTKRRPQSGNKTNRYWNPTTETFQNAAGGTVYLNGQNFWVPMGNWPTGNLNTYNTSPANVAASSVSIGSENYLLGGMEVNIHARATSGSLTSNSYEAAYRSVFVFNHAAINGNSDRRDLSQALQATNSGAALSNRELTRMYVRGGNTTEGDPDIPGFPVARDRTLGKKARLMTPFDVTESGGNNANRDTRFGTSCGNCATTTACTVTCFNGSLTNTHIPTNGNTIEGNDRRPLAQYLWFWVTWGLNVPCYTDLLVGQMADETASTIDYDWHHVQTKDMYGTWTYSKEHYPVLPGRTTIVESRGVYGQQADGGHDGSLTIGPVATTTARDDLTTQTP